MGQLLFSTSLASHFSRHRPWKACPHGVSFHTIAADAVSSPKQMGQSRPSDGGSTVFNAAISATTSLGQDVDRSAGTTGAAGLLVPRPADRRIWKNLSRGT
jgi:hypothetical protein